jgi:hypothetical protein
MKLISFETAKLAKENGFIQACEYHYNSVDGHLYRIGGKPELQLFAPTQSMMCGWLRKEHKIQVLPFVDDDQTYGYHITRFVPEGRLDSPIRREFVSYEEALEAGLQYALTLINEPLT